MKQLLGLLLFVAIIVFVSVSGNDSEEPVVEQNTQWYIKKTVGGCFTKEDSKQFAEYAFENNIAKVDEMMRMGKIITVGPGKCKMIRAGLLESYIEFNGNRVYVSTDDLTTDINRVEW